jgi:hypothetical protein
MKFMRTFVVLLVVTWIAPLVLADCVECIEMSCSYTKADGTIVVTEAPRCTRDLAAGYGYEDCRNLSRCGGCMGWTCVTRDPAGFAGNPSELSREEKIEPALAALLAPDTAASCDAP